MNSNQRSQGNKQSDNGANEKSVSSSRGGTADKDNLPGGSQQQGARGSQSGQRQGTAIDQATRDVVEKNMDSTDRSGAQSGNQQQGKPGQRQSKDAAGANRMAADEEMDDDTGLSNRANRQSSEQDQSRQSNVGRRDDGAPD